MNHESIESSGLQAQLDEEAEMESLEGKILQLQDDQQVRDAVELAFDYRGDVTLDLTSGESVEGYVFNRTVDESRSQLEMFLRGGSETRVIQYADILAIHFSGEDTACGKSWEAWIQKKQAKPPSSRDSA